MSLTKTPAEIKSLRAGGKILAGILHEVATMVRPGVSTIELNNLAQKLIAEHGLKPSFLNYGPKNNPFPAVLCTSVNQAVVHGIPSAKTILKEGDIVGLDIGAWYQGLCTDMAITAPVGKISSKTQKLIQVTQESLKKGLQTIHAGARVGDIGAAVQTYVETNGFSVVRALVGHGVGHAVHEDPPIPNFGKVGTGLILKSGMVIAVEPMVNAGVYQIKVLDDGWTVVTIDGSLSAHFEHTVVVTDEGCEILTLP